VVSEAGGELEVGVTNQSNDGKRGKGREGSRTPTSERERAAEEAFIRGVMERGEAAKPDRDGKLPSGATHEIVEEVEGGLPKIRRRRFSMR
jgi:hypothetical protein